MTIIQIYQLLGLAFFALGLGMLANPKTARQFFEETVYNAATVYYAGLAALIIGYLLITFSGRSIFLFIVGWLALIKGLYLLLFPASAEKLGKMIAKRQNCLAVSTWVILLLGLLFLFIGYFS